ncbi:LysR family transcriptional regulator [Pyxidicoccus fallax]|uniref:LysR family transcriptional regulator n=1 Tax=Pyxidicoccus fallax TaxID=394095 RepID=A0A848LMZ2_9BACT|nr:LysR family transcriptional regulator [Pyxidicoccus fallax]NMO18944.1 LysR family transcriptional regulator [Pyxidicoccus fallax]NPC80184.1 LysR family transcriptional regulator [Pyxidicoccus fallax]
MDRLSLLETFVRIVEAGSLSAAAEQLGSTQPTISRRLQALERSLGVRLLNRSTRALMLTEEGQRCFARARELLGAWRAFESDMHGEGEEPSGTLRVVAPHALGQQHFIGAVVEYLRRHPRVSVEWLLHDEVQSLVAQGIDCVIQVGEVTDLGLVAVKLSEVERIAVAAPSLLRGRGVPREPSELGDLPWLAFRLFYRSTVTMTHLRDKRTQEFQISPRMSTDSIYAMKNAALLGLGACVISAWVVADELAQGSLVRLAPEWRAAPQPVFAAFPQAPIYPAKLRRFIEAVRTVMPALVAG